MSLTAQMIDKQTALVALIEATLAAHGGPAWTVETRYRRAIHDGMMSAQDRQAVMGNPIRYVRVADVGASDGVIEDMAMNMLPAQVRTQFLVMMWLAYIDADTYGGSSQATWDAVREQDDGVTPGLLVALREAGSLVANPGSDQCIVYLLNPTDYIVLEEPIHMGEDVFCHFASFFVTVL